MSDESRDSGGWSGGGKGEGDRGQGSRENEEAIAFGRKVGLGCFTFVIGFFSGGMVAVLLGRMIEMLRRSPSCEGLPVCNWYVYVGIGGVIGALSLPVLVLSRLRRR
jgi:hypothetical protein